MGSMRRLLHSFRNSSYLNHPRRDYSSMFDEIGVRDKYGALRIDFSKLNTSSSEFVEHVTRLCNTKPAPFPAIWVTLSAEEFHIVPSLCLSPPKGAGFEFHHAIGRTATLIRWLNEGPSKIPEYATHQLGVAGILANAEKTHVLMVREKHGSLFPGWKFPTGLAYLGENITDAILREVYEECGISAVFGGVIAIRQQHQFPGIFGRSDLLAICRLELAPGTQGLPEIQPCQNELSDSKWMPLTELHSAQVHSVIDAHNFSAFADPHQVHITKLSSELLSLLSHDSKHPSVEFRPRRLPAIAKGRWYDLYVPYRRP